MPAKLASLIVHTATHRVRCNTLHRAAPQCYTHTRKVSLAHLLQCTTLQHTATHSPHYNTLHHTAPRCYTRTRKFSLAHLLHCTTLHHAAPQCTTLHHTATHCTTLHHTATHCTTLHHAAPRCTTLQHTAPRCNTRTSKVSLAHLVGEPVNLPLRVAEDNGLLMCGCMIECLCMRVRACVRACVNMYTYMHICAI